MGRMRLAWVGLVWVIGTVWVDGQERDNSLSSLDVRNEKCCCPRSSLCLSVCLSVLIVSPVCVCVSGLLCVEPD